MGILARGITEGPHKSKRTAYLTAYLELTRCNSPSSQRRRRLLVLFPAFLVLTLFSVLALANLFGPSSGHNRFYGASASKHRMSLDEVLNGTFYPESKRVEWVAAPADSAHSGEQQRMSSLVLFVLDLGPGKGGVTSTGRR